MRLALAEPDLAVGALALAVFEALLADLVLGDERGFAQLERKLLLVDLRDLRLQLLFELLASLHSFLEALPRRVGKRLEFLEARFAFRERALLFLNASDGQLVDNRSRRLRNLFFGASQRRFDPVDLGLAGRKLELPLVEVGAPRGVVAELRALGVELQRSGVQLCSQLLELERARRDLIAARGQLGLGRRECTLGFRGRLAILVELLLGVIDVSLALEERLGAFLRLALQRADSLRRLGLQLDDGCLALGQRGSLLLQLGRGRRTSLVGRFQLVRLLRSGLLALGDAKRGRVDLRTKLLELGVALVELCETFVDMLFLAAHDRFALVQRSCLRLEVEQAPADLLLELDLASRGVELVAERLAQLVLARECGVELCPQLVQTGIRRRRRRRNDGLARRAGRLACAGRLHLRPQAAAKAAFGLLAALDRCHL